MSKLGLIEAEMVSLSEGVSFSSPGLQRNMSSTWLLSKKCLKTIWSQKKKKKKSNSFCSEFIKRAICNG